MQIPRTHYCRSARGFNKTLDIFRAVVADVSWIALTTTEFHFQQCFTFLSVYICPHCCTHTNTNTKQQNDREERNEISPPNASAECQYIRSQWCPYLYFDTNNIFFFPISLGFHRLRVCVCVCELRAFYSRDNEHKYSPFDMCIFFNGTRVKHSNEIRDSEKYVFESKIKQKKTTNNDDGKIL